jgi:hypothetical protein
LGLSTPLRTWFNFLSRFSDRRLRLFIFLTSLGITTKVIEHIVMKVNTLGQRDESIDV